jgi:SAM-dependent methyltransferase
VRRSEEVTVKRAFVDYYRERDISPVHQDISDRERHFGRRSSLYRYLGIPPLYVEGAHVLEFGPGSGDNALHTASLGPERYVLVDGNPRGVTETRAKLATTALPEGVVEVVASYVEDFKVVERFDLVVAEGLIPFQNEPVGFARHIASFVRPGGMLVVTCADSASAIGEIGRRLLANRIAPPSLPYAERRAQLSPVFASHLATLEGMSRSVDDWVDDNIAQPLTGKLYSMADAIESLAGDGFVVTGSSPQFLTDWRWYKRVYGSERNFNERAVESYYENVVNFLDYRETLDAHDAGIGRRIRTACDALYEAMHADDAGDAAGLPAAIAHLNEIAQLVEPIAASTAASLHALAVALAGDAATARATNAFSAHFGRGQQYLSFTRNH